MKKRAIGVILALAVVGGGFFVSRTLKPAALLVETAKVSRGTLQVTVSEEGQTRIRERYVIAAPVAGLLMRIELKEGDLIQEGDVISLIYPAPENAREMQTSQAQLSAAYARRGEAAARVSELEARIVQLNRDTERARKLAQSGALTTVELEDRELALNAAQEQLKAAKAAVVASTADAAAARVVVVSQTPKGSKEGAVPISAPTTGQVLRIFEDSERVVPAGTQLLAIGQADQLEAVIDLLSEDAVKVPAGASVALRGWGSDEVLQGQVTSIEPEAYTKVSTLGVEEQRVNVIASIKDAPKQLGAGYRVEASIVIWSGDGIVSVPTSAIFRRDNSWHTFINQGGRASLRSVTLGHRSTERAEVVSGLAEGDSVIVFPSEEIKAGVAVQSR